MTASRKSTSGLTRRQAFLPFLTRGAFDIVQPDATKMGGISEQRRVAWMAQDFGVKYVGHGWNTALGVAADLQIAAALPNVDLVEFIGGSALRSSLPPTVVGSAAIKPIWRGTM